VNLQDGSSQVIPTQVSVMGSWSPDGASLIYTELAPEALAPYLSLYKVNLVDQSIASLTPDSTQLLDFSLPEYSADGQNLVVGVRSVNNQSYKQLWLLDAAGNFQQTITAEPMLAHASYHWAPSGDWLVYQQIDLSQKNNDPEVVLWNRSSNAYIALVKAAALPEWLP
jgi:Tol biopolymer transport system component